MEAILNEMEMGMHGMLMVGGSAGAVMAAQAEAEAGLRRGPWSVEEDLLLVNYIAAHGEGRWNSLARSAGLKRSGKSCRLRWLNYLRPDVRRGNFTPEEQLLILELHSRWGNRWSKIAQHLPGRTDNEIKNYWRTRVQKHAKQLKCDVNSQKFRDAMRYLWMPRLMERMQAAVSASPRASVSTVNPTATVSSTYVVPGMTVDPMEDAAAGIIGDYASFQPDHSSMAGLSSDSSVETCLSPPPAVSNLTDCYIVQGISNTCSELGDDFGTGHIMANSPVAGCPESPLSPSGYLDGQVFTDLDLQSGWEPAGDFPSTENLWDVDDIWFLEEHLPLTST